MAKDNEYIFVVYNESEKELGNFPTLELAEMFVEAYYEKFFNENGLTVTIVRYFTNQKHKTVSYLDKKAEERNG